MCSQRRGRDAFHSHPPCAVARVHAPDFVTPFRSDRDAPDFAQTELPRSMADPSSARELLRTRSESRVSDIEDAVSNLCAAFDEGHALPDDTPSWLLSAELELHQSASESDAHDRQPASCIDSQPGHKVDHKGSPQPKESPHLPPPVPSHLDTQPTADLYRAQLAEASYSPHRVKSIISVRFPGALLLMLAVYFLFSSVFIDDLSSLTASPRHSWIATVLFLTPSIRSRLPWMALPAQPQSPRADNGTQLHITATAAAVPQDSSWQARAAFVHPSNEVAQPSTATHGSPYEHAVRLLEDAAVALHEANTILSAHQLAVEKVPAELVDELSELALELKQGPMRSGRGAVHVKGEL